MTYTNRDRADLGRNAIRAGTVGRYEDRQEQLTDALANIMHFVAHERLIMNERIDFHDAVNSAAAHYLNETGG